MAAPKPSTDEGLRIAERFTLPEEHGGLLGHGGLWRLICRLRWESVAAPKDADREQARAFDREQMERAVRIAQKANRERTAPRMRRPLNLTGEAAEGDQAVEWSAKPMRADQVRKLCERAWRQYRPGRRPGASPVISRRLADKNRAELAALAEYAATDAEWKGRGAASERRLFLAFLRIARSCARMTFTASNRQLREATGIASKDALTRAKRALIGRRLIEVVQNADKAPAEPWKQPKATEYRILLPATVARRLKADPDGQTRTIKALAGVGFLDPDLMDRVCPSADDGAPGAAPWRWNGFGESARLVWCALRTLPEGEGATEAELHRAVNGPVRRTVKRALERLAIHGLAVEDGAGRWMLTGLEPADALSRKPCDRGCKADSVVRDCPVHDAVDRQKRRHQAEREAFDEWRAKNRRKYLLRVEAAREKQARREAAEKRRMRAPALRADRYADRKALLRRQGEILMAQEAAAARAAGSPRGAPKATFAPW